MGWRFVVEVEMRVSDVVAATSDERVAGVVVEGILRYLLSDGFRF